MSRVNTWIRGAALLGAMGALAACEPEVNVLGTEAPAAGEMFRNYVALGNSITAGYQSTGINDSTQRKSYAYLFAQQVGTRFAYPSLAAPGCPPPVVNFVTQSRGSAGGVNFTPTTCALRSPTGFTDRLNNVAVPGATSLDPTADTTSAGNTLTALVLGGKSQVERALEIDPTFASIWIGNNDVLGPALNGVLAGVTPVATFTSRYDQMLSELTTGAPDLEGVLIGVVQVSNVPLMFQVGVLLASPAAKGAFDQAAGGATIIEPNCVANPTTLIAFPLAQQMASGAHPRIISCGPSTLAPNTVVGEVAVLTPAEQTTLTNTINAYNAHIQAKANELGWAYVDVNPTLVQLRGTGAIPAFPNLAQPTNAFGTYISLDGVHPRDAAHRLIANLVIDAVNAKYSTSIPRLTP